MDCRGNWGDTGQWVDISPTVLKIPISCLASVHAIQCTCVHGLYSKSQQPCSDIVGFLLDVMKHESLDNDHEADETSPRQYAPLPSQVKKIIKTK